MYAFSIVYLNLIFINSPQTNNFSSSSLTKISHVHKRHPYLHIPNTAVDYVNRNYNMAGMNFPSY